MHLCRTCRLYLICCLHLAANISKSGEAGEAIAERMHTSDRKPNSEAGNGGHIDRAPARPEQVLAVAVVPIFAPQLASLTAMTDDTRIWMLPLCLLTGGDAGQHGHQNRQARLEPLSTAQGRADHDSKLLQEGCTALLFRLLSDKQPAVCFDSQGDHFALTMYATSVHSCSMSDVACRGK